MKTKKIQFKNKKGLLLSAKLELPLESYPAAYAIFAHCFTCSKNLNAVSNISRALTQKSIAVLRFDFTGLGESEGDFADTNFSTNVDDLISVAEHLAAEYEAPSILIGHSLGGAASIIAAHKIPSLKAVVTIGAPFDPKDVKHLLQDSIEEIEEKGEAEVSIGGRPFKIKKQFLDDLNSKNSEDKIRHINKALLIMHSPRDTTVSINNAAKIYKAAVHPKSFISLDGADHLLSKKEDSLYAGELIASWVKKYIKRPEKIPLSALKQVVARTGEKGYLSEIKAGVHTLIADEPVEVGGNDFGPTPYDLLLSSLGACTGMTLRMYADRKKWDLKEIKVHLQHSKTHASDCGACEDNKSKIDYIERVIEVEGNLDEDQKRRLIEIADKCPVHKTLHSEIKVDTKLKE